ncbi:polysaccharide export protein [Vitreoscilla sp. C1]|uniref:polysaccharide export protein n=1 Tax=Vitreoscilla sp. (strain C1) TaxID=96942 RepID=UPI001C10F315|nr:polysaccharide export protein [Vitreoscilla sp. C1]
MKSVKNIVLISSMVASLAACTVPGSALKINNKNVVAQSDQHVSIDELVDIYPITPLLVQRLQKPALHSKENIALLQAKQKYQYRVQAGDVLRVTVWDHPQLMAPVGVVPVSSSRDMPTTAGQVIHEDGRIYYPYVGAISVAGKTTTEIRRIVTQRLAGYIKNPKVEVDVVQYRSQRVYVSGAVRASNQLPITNVPLTLLDAINNVGGYNENADIQNIKITRDGRDLAVSLYDLMQHGDLSQNLLLKDGDVVYVPNNERMKVHILGEVQAQKTLRMEPAGMTLTAALGAANGLNNNIANAKGVFVIRAESGMSNNKIGKIYQLDLSDASAHVLGAQFQLEPNDVVYVTAAPVARWNRVLSNIFPSVSSLLAVSNSVGSF